MTTALLATDGNSLSHVTRLLEIALKLREKSMVCEFACSGRYAELLEWWDFKVHAIHTLDPRHVEAVDRRSGADYYDAQSLREAVEDELRLYDRVAPDVVVSDFRASCNLSARVAQVKHAVVLNASWTHFGTLKAFPPETFGLIRCPARFVGRLHKASGVAVREGLRSLLSPFVEPIKGLELRGANRPFRKLQRQYRVPMTADLFETWADADLVLVADAPQFSGLKAAAPDHFKVVGPVVWESGPFEEPPTPSSPPYAYITMGSTGDMGYVEEAVSVAGGLGLTPIVTTAGRSVTNGVAAAQLRYASGLGLMAMSEVAVTQGGSGTLYQAMLTKTPIVCIPVLHDQEWNAARVEELSLGVRVHHIGYDREQLRAAVQGARNRSSAEVQRAHALADELCKLGGARSAADLIERELT